MPRPRAAAGGAARAAQSVRRASATIPRVAQGPDAKRLTGLVWLRRVRDRIDREYDKPLNVESLARDVHMSAGHLSREFRRAFGESPYSYLMTRRIERAMALLRTGVSVTDACMAVGCTSLGSFSTRFTELVGETPSSYRAREHRAVASMPPCVAKARTRPIRNASSRIREADRESAA